MKVDFITSRPVSRTSCLRERLNTWLNVFESDECQLVVTNTEAPAIGSLPIPWKTCQVSDDRITRRLSLSEAIEGSDWVVCLDFASAEELILSNLKTRCVLDLNRLPSCDYIDHADPLDKNRLAVLIERETLIMRRCELLVCPNLAAQQIARLRGGSPDQFVQLAFEIAKPSPGLTEQSLQHFVYYPESVSDGLVVCAALKRLQFPWKLSILVDNKNEHIVRQHWTNQPRTRIIEQLDWNAVIETAWLALCGGAESKHAGSGLELSILALLAPKFGVPVFGTDDFSLRLTLGVNGLVPGARPDLYAEGIDRLFQEPELRSELHFQTLQKWSEDAQKVDYGGVRSHFVNQI